MKKTTLVYILKEREEEEGKFVIVLGMKKRGFGKNKMNGAGGKVEKGEIVVEAGCYCYYCCCYC